MSQIPSHDHDHSCYDPRPQESNGSKPHGTPPFSVLRMPVPASTSADSMVPQFDFVTADTDGIADISQHSNRTVTSSKNARTGISIPGTAYEESWNDCATILYEVEPVNTNMSEDNRGE